MLVNAARREEDGDIAYDLVCMPMQQRDQYENEILRAKAAAEEARPDEAKKTGPRPLPPGWFRATPQMMSLVGCSEPPAGSTVP